MDVEQAAKLDLADSTDRFHPTEGTFDQRPLQLADRAYQIDQSSRLLHGCRHSAVQTKRAGLSLVEEYRPSFQTVTLEFDETVHIRTETSTPFESVVDCCLVC